MCSNAFTTSFVDERCERIFPNLNPFGQFADDVRRMVFQVTADKSWRHRVRGLGLNPELTFDVANNSMISLTPAHPSKRVEPRSAHTERDRCLARDTAEATMSCLADELRTRDWRGSARASLMCTRCSRHFSPSSFCVWLVYQVKSLLYVEVLKVAAYFPARCEKQNLVALWRCRDSWFRKVSQSCTSKSDLYQAFAVPGWSSRFKFSLCGYQQLLYNYTSPFQLFRSSIVTVCWLNLG